MENYAGLLPTFCFDMELVGRVALLQAGRGPSWSWYWICCGSLCFSGMRWNCRPGAGAVSPALSSPVNRFLESCWWCGYRWENRYFLWVKIMSLQEPFSASLPFILSTVSQKMSLATPKVSEPAVSLSVSDRCTALINIYILWRFSLTQGDMWKAMSAWALEERGVHSLQWIQNW